jgi:hypothetical protein
MYPTSNGAVLLLLLANASLYRLVAGNSAWGNIKKLATCNLHPPLLLRLRLLLLTALQASSGQQRVGQPQEAGHGQFCDEGH